MLAEGKDRYYVASGLEYTAYTKWQKALLDVETAGKTLSEAKYELNNDKANDHIGYAKLHKDALYEVERAKTATEWETAQRAYNEIKTMYDSLI